MTIGWSCTASASTETIEEADKLGWRWLLVALRVAGWLLTFAIIIIPHLLLSLVGLRHVVPPPFLGALAWISGVRVHVRGKPRPHALLLGNHVSWMDILTLAGVSRTAFVAQAGLSTHPFLAWLCLQNDTLFITRDKRSTVAEQVDAVREKLGKRRLTIFPESTTNDGTALLPFRSSLLSAVERLPKDIPVQPFALEYEEAAEVCWYGDEPGLDNFRKILARTKPVYLTIHFLDPLEGEELTNRKTMAAAAQAKVAKALRL